MALEDYYRDMQRCSRCSYCKWIPLAHVKSLRFAKGCPSVEYNKFHSYSGGGRMIAALSLLEGRSGYSDRLLDVAYSCQACGSCDISCKVCRYDMEPLHTILELRARLVADAQLLPAHRAVIDGLRKEDNMMMKPKADRGEWAKDLGLKNLTKESAEVVFHAGCRLSYDKELWKVKMNIIIRNEKGSDYRIVEELTREAFWNLYVPGCNEHFILHNLRNSSDFIPELDFIAEKEGQNCRTYCLQPRDYQRQTRCRKRSYQLWACKRVACISKTRDRERFNYSYY